MWWLILIVPLPLALGMLIGTHLEARTNRKAFYGKLYDPANRSKG